MRCWRCRNNSLQCDPNFFSTSNMKRNEYWSFSQTNWQRLGFYPDMHVYGFWHVLLSRGNVIVSGTPHGHNCRPILYKLFFYNPVEICVFSISNVKCLIEHAPSNHDDCRWALLITCPWVSCLHYLPWTIPLFILLNDDCTYHY